MTTKPEDRFAEWARCYACCEVGPCATGLCRDCTRNAVSEWARLDRAALLREIDAQNGIKPTEPGPEPMPPAPTCA